MYPSFAILQRCSKMEELYIHDLWSQLWNHSGHALACESVTERSDQQGRLSTFPPSKNENGTEISRTEPHRFLYLIRSNPYFLVRLYRFRFRIWDVSYFKCKSRKRFTHFSTVFYFSTFNLKYSEFKIRFKPNLANCTGHTAQLQAAHHAAAFFLLVASCPLL